MTKKKPETDLLPVGRKPLWETVEQLEKKIEEYFDSGVPYRTFIVGSGNNKQSIEVQVPTITGLCLFCGFESRQSFYDYEKNPEFTYIIKKARLKIENLYEEQLQYGNTTGAIFALKNMNWHDKTEQEITTPNVKINFVPTKPD